MVTNGIPEDSNFTLERHVSKTNSNIQLTTKIFVIICHLEEKICEIQSDVSHVDENMITLVVRKLQKDNNQHFYEKS